MANGFGQPPQAPGAPIAPGVSPVPDGPDPLFSMISSMVQNMPQTAMDKVREAVRLLEEAREEDPKLGHISLAMGIIKNGPRSLEDFDHGSPKGQSDDRRPS